MTKKLSVCMIVKDEEKNLPRCLNSLKPLLEQDYSELIIVDTGSTDDTVEIAKRYTDKVFFHEWNGSFSDMRNISISYAVGEWIFIIDADEELESSNELIDLLKNPKLAQFNTVRIREKNLLSIKSNKYVYHVQERLFRNDGEFQYRGTIHNQPIYKHPVLVTDIWLMHYGYINEDKDLMEKKFKRTANMLKKELAKNPEYVYYRFQLARSYMMHGEGFAALEEITKAYESMRRQNKELIIHRYYVFGEYARMSLNAKKYEQVVNICKEGLSYNENYLDLYYYMGHAYLLLEQEEKGIEALEKYLILYVKYINNELDLSNFSSIEMYTVDEEAFQTTLGQIISTFYKNRSLVPNTYKYQSWLELLNDKTLKYKFSAKLLMAKKDYDALLDLYKNIEEKEQRLLANYVEVLKRELEKEEREKLEFLFSTLPDGYGLLNCIRVTNDKSKLLVKFINQYNIIEYVDEVIIEFTRYLIEYNYLPRLFKKLDRSLIKKIVKVLMDEEDKIDYFLNSLHNDYKFKDFQNNRIYISIANVILLSLVEEEGNKTEFNKEVNKVFDYYVTRGTEYVQYIYNAERIRLTYSTFENKEEKFFALLYLANDAFDKGNIQSHNKLILEAITEYPYLSSLLKVYISEKLALIS